MINQISSDVVGILGVWAGASWTGTLNPGFAKPRPYFYITDYNPEWENVAARLMNLINNKFSQFPWFKGIVHIGSTAIPGMAAKPIIDTMVGVDGGAPLKTVINELIKLGFDWSEKQPGFVWSFKNPDFGLSVHIVEHLSPKWRLKILFRDHFLAYPEEVQAYGNIKRALMEESRGFNEYKNKKEPYIASVLGRYGYTPQDLLKIGIISKIPGGGHEKH